MSDKEDVYLCSDFGEPRPPLGKVASWVPEAIVRWLTTNGHLATAAQWNWCVRLALDERMRPVWEWHASQQDPAVVDRYRTALGLFWHVDNALKLPEKPRNLTGANRKAYFDSVRLHAKALLALVADTKFSSNSGYQSGTTMTSIDLDDLGQTVLSDLSYRRPKEGEDDRIVGYVVSHDGVSRLPPSFPTSHVYDLLTDLVDWTYLDDCWGDSSASSQAISHANTANTRVIFFTRTIFESLTHSGITIPFAHLATLANVALDLPVTRQVDEDSVRKQIQRYEAKRSKRKSSREQRK